MKFYIAGPWREKLAVRAIRAHLESLGHESTASWINQEGLYGGSEVLREEAIRDLAELRDADVLVVYSPERDSSRGGCHTELGYALCDRYPIILIGKRSQVFHYHPDLRHFESIRAWKEASDAVYS